MCIFICEMHVCGHSKYTIKRPCQSVFIHPETNLDTCGALETQTGPPPASHIAETFCYPYNTCTSDTCGYDPTSDPFLPTGAAAHMSPRKVNPRASLWSSSPPPSAARSRENLGKVLRSETMESATSSASSGSQWLQRLARPGSESPPSLDDEARGKISLYDELLPHGYELASDDELAAEILHVNYSSSTKRRNSSSPTFSRSPPPRLGDSNGGNKRKNRDVWGGTEAVSPSVKKQKGSESVRRSKRLAVLDIRTAGPRS